MEEMRNELKEINEKLEFNREKSIVSAKKILNLH
jgi:hypothetical protein